MFFYEGGGDVGDRPVRPAQKKRP